MNVLGGATIVNDERILAALLSANSVTEAAKDCGISKTTIYARLKDPVFNAKYEAACRDVLKNVKAALQIQMGEAVNVMAEVMNEKKNAPQIRLNAADAVLRHGLRLTEKVDIVERLDKMEGED